MKKLVALILGVSLAALTIIPAMAAEPAAGPGVPSPATAPANTPPPASDLPLYGPRLAAAPQPGVRIGFVDMAKVASNSVPGKAATSEMKTRTTRLRNQMQSREKQLSKQKAAIESTIASLTPAQREAKAKEFQKKVADYQKFVQKAGKDIQAREGQLLRNIFTATQKAAEEYAKSNGFAAVMIKKDILFLGVTVEAKDLTDEIIRQLDKKPAAKK